MVLVGAKLEQCLSEALKEELSRQREGETSIQAEGMRVQRCWGGVDGGGAGGPCGLTQWLRGRVTEMSLGGLGGVGRRPGGERWGPWGGYWGPPLLFRVHCCSELQRLLQLAGRGQTEAAGGWEEMMAVRPEQGQ